LQIVIRNTHSGREVVKRLNTMEDFYKLSAKYPRLREIMLRHSEDADFLKRVLLYFNKRSGLSARLIEDNPMRKTEMSRTDQQEFRTRLDGWAITRQSEKRKLFPQSGAVDPGRLIEDEKKPDYPQTTIGKLADRFARWRGKK